MASPGIWPLNFTGERKSPCIEAMEIRFLLITTETIFNSKMPSRFLYLYTSNLFFNPQFVHI